MRIVSICPSNTELVGYLELTDKLVGIDDFSDWPKEVNGLRRLGSDLDIDMDKLEELKPDIVLASLSVPGMEKNVEQLKKRNIPHIVLNPNSLAEIRDSLIETAEVLGVKKRGEQLAGRFDAIVEQYEKLSAAVAREKTLYWEWWPKPVFTPGKKNWLTDVSRLAGARNVFETENVASFQTTWEDVYARNPGHICLVWVGLQEEKVDIQKIISRPNWHNLSAVKNRRLYVLEESIYCRPSPRILEGLAKLAHLLHPDVFPGYNGKDPLKNP